MKKLLILILALIMVMSLCACGEDSAEKDTPATRPETGDLIISLSSELSSEGAVLSDSEDGSDPQTGLSADMVKDCTNITYDWLPATLDLEAYGSHNGKNYMAYTFSLTNTGKESIDYSSALKITDAANGADECCRVMIYRNGEPTVYAKKNTGQTSGNGTPEPFETLFKKAVPENYKAPSKEEIAAAAETQNKEFVETTDEALPITAFLDDTTIFRNQPTRLGSGETDKYTVVFWIEGDDPECTDDIRGGYVKCKWDFE